MQPALKQRFDLLQQRKNSFMQILKQATPAQRNFKPAGNGWNMLQVGEHLAAAEHGLFIQAIKGEPMGQPSLRSNLTFWLVVALFKTPIRIKAPKAAMPKKELTFEALSSLWQRGRKQMGDYLEAQPESALSRPVLNHPFVKPMTLGQALLFFQVHLEHHMHQLKRIQKAEGFPK